LTFAPIRFLHPLRVVHLRALHIALVIVWALLAIAALAANLQPGLAVTIPLAAIAIYFFLAGLLHRPA